MWDCGGVKWACCIVVAHGLCSCLEDIAVEAPGVKTNVDALFQQWCLRWLCVCVCVCMCRAFVGTMHSRF